MNLNPLDYAFQWEELEDFLNKDVNRYIVVSIHSRKGWMVSAYE